jgi:TonB family protein
MLFLSKEISLKRLQQIRPARMLTLLILLGAALTPSIFGQSDDLVNQLNSAYKGKILLLRNFYSDEHLTYDQSGALQGTANSGPWTLAGVEIKGIAVVADEVLVTGNRMGTLYKQGKPTSNKVGTVKIELAKATSGENALASADAAFKKIFIDPTEDLRPMLPEFWRPYLSGSDLQSKDAAWQAILEKRPVAPAKKEPGVTPPRALFAPDPQCSKEAESRHIGGTVVLNTVVETTGMAAEVSIAQPLGMGLDEQAILALQKWRFSPATKDGHTAPVLINIEVAFRCPP